MDLIELLPKMQETMKEPVIKHECKQQPEEDEVEKLIKGTSVFARLNRWLARKRILSTSHYYAQSCLKSSTAVRYEISSHLQNFPRMIHPFSPFRNFWDLTMTIFTFSMLILTPYLSAFFFDNEISSLPYILCIDFVMLFDVVLQFFTGYLDRRTKIVTLDPRIVFTKYVKGYFILDLISALPVEVLDVFLHGEKHINWYCSTFNLVKILRIRNLICYIHQFQKSFHVSFQRVKILELTIIVIITMHWSACLVYYVPMLSLKFNEFRYDDSKSWILSDSMAQRDTRMQKYILCLNRATISLVSSAHYLDVSTAEDMLMNFLLAAFGKLGFIYLLAQFLQLMTTFHSPNKERLRLLQQLQEYMQYKELPSDTQKRLLVYYNYWYKKNFNRDRSILAQISEPLREELILHNYSKMLETVDLLKELPSKAIVQLANRIKPEIYLANDVIVKSGSRGDSLYFVGSGTVAVYTNLGKEVCHLEDGSYFGEIALVMENEQRIANVVAIETCEILVIPRESFQQVIQLYPSLLVKLQKVALKRLQKTMLVDEIYRMEDPNPRYINISNVRGRRWDW